jgi:hypothetical protein
MLVTAPDRLDEAGVETLLARIARAAPRIPDGIDCSGLRFAGPGGILALLAVGLSGPFRGGRAWGLVMPRDPAVVSYLERCGAREHLENLFVVAGRPREEEPRRAGAREPVLLEVTLVREAGDIHRTVARIKARADLLLVSRLGYSSLAADRFTVAMAEVCQNIVDHSGSPGLAAAQCYVPAGGGGAPEIRLAVADVGVGMRASLAPRYAAGFPGTWSDQAAVRLAFRPGVTRCDDPDRGLGLKAVAEMVRGWRGTLRLRSGTAALTLSAAEAEPGPGSVLTAFPGTQVSIRLSGAPGFSLR